MQTAWRELTEEVARDDVEDFHPRFFRSGNGAERVNEVTLRRARLVLGWLTLFARANHLGMLLATQANSASYPQRNGK